MDNPPMINAVRAGQTVPVKFNLGGNRGLTGQYQFNWLTDRSWAGTGAAELGTPVGTMRSLESVREHSTGCFESIIIVGPRQAARQRLAARPR